MEVRKQNEVIWEQIFKCARIFLSLDPAQSHVHATAAAAGLAVRDLPLDLLSPASAAAERWHALDETAASVCVSESKAFEQ